MENGKNIAMEIENILKKSRRSPLIDLLLITNQAQVPMIPYLKYRLSAVIWL